MPTLTIQLPGLPPVDHILREEMITIGRMKGNTIALDDASVSVSHAKITRTGADFFLKDLNSTNGTMLNGQSVNEARLKDGDQLKFGEVIAYYRAEPQFAGPNTVPAIAPAPAVSQTAPVPAAPVVTSTSFVSKRLVSQAAPAPAAAPAAAVSSQTSHTSRARRKKQNLLLPLAVGGVVMVVVIVLAVQFFKVRTDAPAKPDAANPPAPSAAPKNSAPSAAPAVTAKPAVAPPKTANGGEGKTMADLKKSLKAADPAERRRAAAALHGLGSGARDAVPELRLALGDADADVRMWSALALINNKSYDKATIPILTQVLRHDNSMLRQVSCLSLALIPYEEADKDAVVTALVEAAGKDDDEEVRKAAVSALKIISPDSPPAGK